MANDHFISRFLTRPWEEPQRYLRYFDFDDERVHRVGSKSLFAEEGVNDRETEDFINRYFERPLSQVQDQLRGTKSLDEAQAVLGAGDYRCYAAILWLQIQRVRDAQAKQERSYLDEIAAKGSDWLDQFAAVIAKDFELSFVAVGKHERIYFPETGLFMVPAGLTPPIMCLPFTTRLFMVFLERTRHTPKVSEILVKPNFAMMCSMGTDHVRRVVIPPDIEAPTSAEFMKARTTVHAQFDLNADLAREFGLDGWFLEPPRNPAIDAALNPAVGSRRAESPNHS